MFKPEQDPIPQEYLCPITRQLMQDPVIAADGHTYEKDTINHWLKTGHTISPVNGKQLSRFELTANTSLKPLIEAFSQNLPASQREAHSIVDFHTAIKDMEEKMAQHVKEKEEMKTDKVELQKQGLKEEEDKSRASNFFTLEGPNTFSASDKTQQWQIEAKEGAEKDSTSNLFSMTPPSFFSFGDKASDSQQVPIEGAEKSAGPNLFSSGSNFATFGDKIQQAQPGTTGPSFSSFSVTPGFSWGGTQLSQQKATSQEGATSISFSAKPNLFSFDDKSQESKEGTGFSFSNPSFFSFASKTQEPQRADKELPGQDNSTKNLFTSGSSNFFSVSQQWNPQPSQWSSGTTSFPSFNSNNFSFGNQVSQSSTGSLIPSWLPKPEEPKIEESRLGLKCIKTLRGHTNPVSGLEILSGELLASCSSDKTIRIWNITKEICLRTLSLNTPESHTQQVTSIKVLPTGELASGSWDSTIKVWDIKTGACLQTLKGHTNNIGCVEVLPTGELVSSSWDRTIKVWDWKNGTCLKTIKGHTDNVMGLALLPASQLASCSWDKTIKIWDLGTETCVKTLEGHTSAVSCIQVLPTGRLASGSSDKSIKIWDVDSGECLKTLEGHDGLIFCIGLMSSGELVTGLTDSTIKIWDVETGKCVETVKGHKGVVGCVKGLPTGKLASGALDFTIKIWN